MPKVLRRLARSVAVTPSPLSAVPSGAPTAAPGLCSTDEFALRTRELEIKAGELEVKRKEARWPRLFVSVMVAILAALISGYFALQQAHKTAMANLEVAQKTADANRELERLKWRQARRDEQLRNTGAATSEYSRQMLRGLQACSTLLTHGVLEPQRFDRTDVARYDATMRDIMPAALHALTQVSVYAPRAYGALSPTLGELAKLYGDMEIVSHRYLGRARAGRKDFEELRARVSEAGKNLRAGFLLAGNLAELDVQRSTGLTMTPAANVDPNQSTPEAPTPDQSWLYLPPLDDQTRPK